MRFLFAIVGLLVAGCGPLHSSSAITTGNDVVAEAEREGAAKYARYEFTKAQAFLAQAKLKQGYSQFHIAEMWAEKATEFAKDAIRIARQRKNLELLRARGKGLKTIRDRRVRKRVKRTTSPKKNKGAVKTTPRKRRSFKPPVLLPTNPKRAQ